MEAATARTHGRRVRSADDRLSALPDAILQTILSFLKARQVVQTSVLARRWRTLWRSVPCIHIDQEEFRSSSSQGEGLTERDCERFEDFTDFLSLHRDRHAVLDMLRLSIADPAPIHVCRWIRRALKCSLRALRIDCNVRVSQTDVLLHIDDLGSKSSSYSLKWLHLCDIGLGEEFIHVIGSAFVHLEHLKVEDCIIYFDKLKSSSLKSLVMDGNEFDMDRLSIITPRLASLRLSGINEPISVQGMESLVDASIHFGIERTSQLKLLENLSNVTSLELSGFFETVASYAEPVEFSYLSTLLLYDCVLGDRLELLRMFLENSPNLEKLTVRYCQLAEGFY